MILFKTIPYHLVLSNHDTGMICIRYPNNRYLIWIKNESDDASYYFSQKNKFRGMNVERLPDIEKWTVIMGKTQQYGVDHKK